MDKRFFKTGDIIIPKTDFEEQMKDEKLKMERMLDAKRAPGIPERRKCLFLFKDLQGTLRFYSKYGGNIYGVIPIFPIFHYGDMNKLDNILDLFKFMDEDKTGVLEAAVNTYWKAGIHTFNPCYELLVGGAEVVELLSDNKRLPQFNKELSSCGSIEMTSLYKELIGKVWQRQEFQASVSHGRGH